jgi:hypothetical protein
MPAFGSGAVAVKAGSPEWGRSGAESLDSTATSPRITTVMTRLPCARFGGGCGSWLLSRGGCEGDAQSRGEPGEIVRPPTVTQGDRDCDRLRILVDRQVAGTADEP